MTENNLYADGRKNRPYHCDICNDTFEPCHHWFQELQNGRGDMTANKTPTGDFIKLNRQDYEIILEWAKTLDDPENVNMPLTPREREVERKIQQILVNIQKFNANKRGDKSREQMKAEIHEHN